MFYGSQFSSLSAFGTDGVSKTGGIEHGLLPGQSKILDYLLSHDGCEQKSLGEAFHLEAATVTGILRRMDEAGLIKKRVKEGNRKSQYVFLTEKGRKMAAETVRPIMKSCEEQALEGITEEEKAILLKGLQKIYENMTKGSKR